MAEGVSLKKLLEAPGEVAWDAVLAQLESGDVNEIRCRIFDAYSSRTEDSFGFYERRRSAAHLCAERGAPLEVFRALHNAAPYIFVEWLPSPLEVACRSAASDSVIRLLLGYAVAGYESSRAQDDYKSEFGEIEIMSQYLPEDPVQPLHFLDVDCFTYAREGNLFQSNGVIPFRILQLLLNEYPQGAWEKYNCGLFHEMTEEALVSSPINAAIICLAKCVQESSLSDGDEIYFWRSFQLLLKATEFGTVREDELQGKNFRPFHALIRYIAMHGVTDQEDIMGDSSYIPLLNFVADKVGSDVRERDDGGLLPLQILVKEPRQGAEVLAKEDVMKAIVGVHPDAVKIPAERGRIPLHYAIENRWPCVSLIQASLPTLGIVDPATGFFPFQLAALSFSSHSLDNIHIELRCVGGDGDKDSLESLTNSFRAIRLNPGIVERATKEAHKEMKSFELIYVLLRANPALATGSSSDQHRGNHQETHTSNQGVKRKRDCATPADG